MVKGRKTEGLYDRIWLEKSRKTAGLKQHQVAEAAGISTGFYNRIEAGVQIPNIKVGMRIADALGFNPHMWLEEKQIA